MARNTKVPLPSKLTSEMSWKCWDDHAQAFDALVTALSVICPRITLDSQNRYSAFYKGKSVLAYVEPQKHRILFGFFKDWVDPIQCRIRIYPVSFPEWNKSKGGLVGFELSGHGEDLPPKIADLAYLVIEAYKSV